MKIYSLGKYFEETYAIKCSDVKDIEEARDIILKYYSSWKDCYTDKKYLKKFGKQKVVILSEEVCYIRYTGHWESYGYEYVEYDYAMSWKKTNKIGRGAMKCYVFYIENSYREFDIYNREHENKKVVIK